MEISLMNKKDGGGKSMSYFGIFPKDLCRLFPKVERMADLQMDVEELDEKAEKSRSKIQNLELTEGTIRKLSQFVAACLL